MRGPWCLHVLCRVLYTVCDLCQMFFMHVYLSRACVPPICVCGSCLYRGPMWLRVRVWVSVPEPLRGRRRHLSQHDTVRRDPPLPLAPALPTWNLNLSPPGSQAKVFLPVCERDTLPHSMRGICAIKAMSSASGCSPFSVHEDRGPTGGSTSAAALGMMMSELSVTLATGRLPSHENWKILKARPSGSVTTRVAEIIL